MKILACLIADSSCTVDIDLSIRFELVKNDILEPCLMVLSVTDSG